MHFTRILADLSAALGLRLGFGTFQWIAALPPILIILGFKIYCTRTFNAEFNYYLPTKEELRLAQVHSQRADNAGNRLERRFGHPALHQDLFTPMVHANMTALLAEVYKGKISNAETKLREYGGTKVDAHVVAGGIKIAGIEQVSYPLVSYICPRSTQLQRDLEYDPTLYQRDRGDDWDARSVSSANLLAPSKSDLMAGRASPAPSKMVGYDRYLAQGPQGEIEMSRFDVDQMPLLTAQQAPGYFDPNVAASRSNVSLSYSPYPSPGPSPQIQPEVPSHFAPQPPPVPAMPMGQDYREAALHRPYPPSREPSGYPPTSSYPPPPGPGGEVNMAGRGAFRG